MGVPWTMDAITFFIDPNGVYWITDVISAMQGILIFLLFVLKREVLSLVVERLVDKFSLAR